MLEELNLKISHLQIWETLKNELSFMYRRSKVNSIRANLEDNK